MTSRLATALACAVVASASSCVDTEIVKPRSDRAMTQDAIAAGLADANFREALAARTQLRALPDGTWLDIVSRLASSPVPSRRLIAVAELSLRPAAQARRLLDELAGDPDDTVRAEAMARRAAPPGGESR